MLRCTGRWLVDEKPYREPNEPDRHFQNWDVSYSADIYARELGLSLDDAVIIGTSGQLRDWKRIDLLLRACALLRPSSFWLLVLGDGPARKQLENLANELGIGHRTVFTGMKEQVGDYLSLMDIFVLPSLGLESFGNAAVEAMSQAIPTIVFKDGGGLLEHIEDKVSGYIVSSVDELGQRLKWLMENESLRREVGQHANDFVRSHYSVERMVTSYDALYQLAIDRKQQVADEKRIS